ncbi:MAG: hypothetical protein QW353_06065 [Candidatus Korarchaeum sp.]
MEIKDESDKGALLFNELSDVERDDMLAAAFSFLFERGRETLNFDPNNIKIIVTGDQTESLPPPLISRLEIIKTSEEREMIPA